MATDNVFKGLSMLRKKEKAEDKPVSEQAKQLQAYLAQQYGGGSSAAAPPKKKKKVKKQQATGAMRIVDNDVSGFATVKGGGAREADDDDEDAPVIANPEEAERLKAVAEREKQFFSKTDDGAGWETIDHPVQQQRRQRHDSPDASPPHRQRHDSPDASPPRRGRRHDSPDASPPRRQRHDSPGDASPPRRRQRHDSPDASPPRRQRHDSPDASLPRRRRRHDSPEDASPPRRPPGAAANAPPHKRQADGDSSGGDEAAKRQRLMSDGTATGMILGRDLAAEMQKKRELEQQRFAKMGADVTGRHAQTVYRDTSGKRVTKEELEAEQAAKSKAAQYEDQAALPWGKGLKQQADAEEARRRIAEEVAKPFIRSYDADHDAAQRDRLRFGDPMAHLVKKRQPELEVPPSLVAKQQEQLKKAGFVIPLEVPAHSWLRRNVGPPSNRYNIKPGRHWDGVDRSNGFEREMYKRQTELRRREQAAFYMAQDDM